MPKPYTKKNPIKNSSSRPDAKTFMDNGVVLKARLWLEKDNEIFIASGRIELLKLLAEHGSISRAAKQMGISYHHAWNLIDRMNALSEEPLVITSQGGKGGGGTELSHKAQTIIAQFEQLQADLQNFIDNMPVAVTDPLD